MINYKDMGKNSKIEWTHHTFNPWWGCAKVSEACKFCYAEAWAKRTGAKVWGSSSQRRFFGKKHWQEPQGWNKAAGRSLERKRVFCASMADVFEARTDLDLWRNRLWKLIESTPWIDWLLLTKRPENITKMVPWTTSWPRNIWLGATVEDHPSAEKRLPFLISCSAALIFISCEPLLSHLDLRPWLQYLDWVIVGGESGHHARPMHPSWARDLRDQCQSTRIPFHFKQWGNWRPYREGPQKVSKRINLQDRNGDIASLVWVGKKAAGRDLDGRTWSEMPVSPDPDFTNQPKIQASLCESLGR